MVHCASLLLCAARFHSARVLLMKPGGASSLYRNCRGILHSCPEAWHPGTQQLWWVQSFFVPHIAMWGFCFSCSIPPPPPPPSPHQHNIINTINTTSSTQHHQHNIINTFAWHPHHLEHLHRGRRKSGGEWCVWAPPHFAWQTQHLEHVRLVLRGRRGTRSTSGSFAWQVQHWKHISCVWRSIQAQTIHTTPSTLHHQTHHHQDNTISTTSPTQSHQHNLIRTSPSTQHHLHNTIYTTSSAQHHLHYIMKHNIINTHHLHYIINTTSSKHIKTTSSTNRHLHNIYTTPSTKHHLHYIIKHWQLQHLEHCHISPSASFLLIPLLLFFVVDCSLFCSVGLFHGWMSEDAVNIWGSPVL